MCYNIFPIIHDINNKKKNVLKKEDENYLKITKKSNSLLRL